MNRCQSNGQNQVSSGALQYEAVTVQLLQGFTATKVDRDILVQFRAPHRFFIIASIAAAFAGSSVFVHFTPLYYPAENGGTAISPVGGEPWIPLSSNQNSTRAEGRFFRTRQPIQQFYIDADHAAVQSATPYLITVIGCDDIEDVIAERV